MQTINLPRTIYVGFADFGKLGLGVIGDFETTIEGAAEAMANTNGLDETARVLRIDFDTETNLPEAASDVTEDCRLIADRWRIAAE